MSFFDDLQQISRTLGEDVAVLYNYLRFDFIDSICAEYEIQRDHFNAIQKKFDLIFKCLVACFFLWPIILVLAALFSWKPLVCLIAFLALPVFVVIPIFCLENILKKFTVVVGVGTLLFFLGRATSATKETTDRAVRQVEAATKTVSRAFAELYFANLVFALFLSVVPLGNTSNGAWIFLISVEAAFIASVLEHHVFANWLWGFVLVYALFLFLGGANIPANFGTAEKYFSSVFSSQGQRQLVYIPNNQSAVTVQQTSQSSSAGSSSSGGGLREETEKITLAYDGQREKDQNTTVLELTIPPVASKKTNGTVDDGSSKKEESNSENSNTWSQWVVMPLDCKHWFEYNTEKPAEFVLEVQYRDGSTVSHAEFKGSTFPVHQKAVWKFRFRNEGAADFIVVSHLQKL